MNTWTLGEPAAALPAATAATIGFFDGVHEGHRHLMHIVSQEAMQRGLTPLVITFDRHPREVVAEGWQPLLLTTLQAKLRLIEQAGMDYCCVLPFSQQMAAMTARQFMHDVLKEQLHVKCLVIGYDHHFGHDRTAGFEQYCQYGREMGIDVVQGDMLGVQGRPVSSSEVRRLLSEGDVEAAADCLGRPYELSGTVGEGEHEGRRIGFPTANILPDDPRLVVPLAGAYIATARTASDTADRPAMVNIGTRPTYGSHDQTIEVHIASFSGNLYGQRLTVAFRRRLRNEQRFSSPEALRRQLMSDLSAAEAYFKTHTGAFCSIHQP